MIGLGKLEMELKSKTCSGVSAIPFAIVAMFDRLSVKMPMR